MMHGTTSFDPITLRQQWADLRRQQPNVRACDAAARLGVSEAQLVAAGCGKGAVRLRDPWDALLKDLPALGHVLALTRNEHAVIEKTGAFGNVDVFNDGVGQVLNEDIDLRLFLRHWHAGFAVAAETKDGPRPSLQFFDAAGTATHKVYLTPASDAAAYRTLVARYTSDDQSARELVQPAAPRPPERPDAEIDAAALRAAWEAMQDTHEFFALLNRFGVTRLQALRLAGTEHARAIAPASLRHVLTTAAVRGQPIMVFVGNAGTVQIHTGPVRAVRPTGPWINVLDEAFNLHVREDRIASGWIVRKPTLDGVVTGLELFSAAGDTIALLFGKRKPGQPERYDWRSLVAELQS